MKIKTLGFMTLFSLSVSITEAPAQIPVASVIKGAIVKVIKAFDLMIQRLQNECIALQNAQKVIENTLSKLKLAQIAEWTEKHRAMYQKFYDELWQVRSTIATYHRISTIINRQKQIVQQYSFTWHMVQQDKHFTQSEIDYMFRVYTGMINESVDNLEQILLVINSFKTQMSDAGRLAIINQAGDRIDKNYYDLIEFNNENIALSLNRSKDDDEVTAVKKLYGLP